MKKKFILIIPAIAILAAVAVISSLSLNSSRCKNTAKNFSGLSFEPTEQKTNYVCTNEAKTPDKNKQIIDELSKYDMNSFFENNEVKNLNEIIKTAEEFIFTNYNVDYENLDGFKEKMMFYFSSSSKGDIWIDNRIEDIKKYNIVSQGRFITDPCLVYIDNNHEIRVRGRLIVMYDSKTSRTLLNEIGLKPDTWYYRDLEILLTIGVDNGLWERGDWTYLGCSYLSKYKQY